MRAPSASVSSRFAVRCLGACLALALAPLALRAQQDPEPRHPFGVADVEALLEVSDVQLSPEGDWVAYVVRSRDLERDRLTSDLHMVSWDGSQRVRLTHSAGSESDPRWSPDGRWLSFLAEREEGAKPGSPAAQTQVWLLDRAGGEAQRLTEIAGGVSEHVWSPDAGKLALIVTDPEDKGDEEGDAEKESEDETPPPIVIDRYLFKRDRIGYLGDRRDRLWLFDLATRSASLLTPGPYDAASPAWSPDGTKIAFVSKRMGDPDRNQNTDVWVVEAREGAEAAQITTWEGPNDSPAWSPDGARIAYLRGGPPKYADYDPAELAVIPAAGGEPTLLTPELDRGVSRPTWSADGASLLFLLEDDLIQTVARVPAAGGPIERWESEVRDDSGVIESFAVGRDGRLAAVLSRPHQPPEVFARDAAGWRALSAHNQPLLERVSLASVQRIEVPIADEVPVHGVLMLPPGYQAGRRYPTIAYIHGGPVGQDALDFDWLTQVLAGHGYVVVRPNYRGSSGRGREFSRAIYADWGNLEVRDILATVDALVERGIADPERLGIGGWSYGGMSTNYAIAADTRFKAAVSGAAISNMLTGYGTDQYVVQYENEVGLPWQEIDTYLKISYPFFRADRIRTPTLFLCGEKDFNVPLINSEQMYQALRSLGVPTQLVIYPGQYHGLTKPSYWRDRLERTVGWFDRYLE
ncbi:MAG TPA: S9 family peptidase [Thermoanaerobaculia bacterium]|nr:S9 family peptidase [Thermoanaerobaculia bacterium]